MFKYKNRHIGSGGSVDGDGDGSDNGKGMMVVSIVDCGGWQCRGSKLVMVVRVMATTTMAMVMV